MRLPHLAVMALIFTFGMALPEAGVAGPLTKKEGSITPAAPQRARSFPTPLRYVAEKIGCLLDPLSGSCPQEPTKPSVDIGCKIDPLGDDCLAHQQ